jgi:acyl-CoA synthetase (AMP-forming)/AMP-acid ligase II
MKMARTEAPSLRDYVAAGPAPRFFWDRAVAVCRDDLVRGTSLGGRLRELAGRSVMLVTSSQITAALTMIELDGLARRMVVVPADTAPDHVASLAAAAEADALVVDEESAKRELPALATRVICAPAVVATAPFAGRQVRTEWVLLTSGTVGVPKLVVNSLPSLTAPIQRSAAQAGTIVWGTFYDIRRYGGLQIFLRAILGGASLVLSSAGEPVADHLIRLGQHGVTHLSGTPSHWRRALMSPAIRKIAPRYVRLSGEIADQAILDSLRAVFPNSAIGHAYASTEAGVAFAVDDGAAGFPASIFDQERDGVAMKVVDDTLHIRSPRTASHYLGRPDLALRDSAGFVDTGDMLERSGDRYVFAGRRGGIINVGGQKVHPEEVEAVINRHPQVRMSLVRSKRNPVTGAIVAAEVVLRAASGPVEAQREVKDDILKLCRDALPRHKVPASISIVPQLEVAATGKLARRNG